MNENQIESRFNRRAKALVKKLGNYPLTNDVLDIEGRLITKKYLGAFAQNEVDLSKQGFSIVNVDTKGQSGSHWVAIYSTPKTVYVFDSFGRTTPKLLKHITAQAKRLNKKVKDADYDSNQHKLSVICGHLSLSWIEMADKYGIRAAMKI